MSGNCFQVSSSGFAVVYFGSGGGSGKMRLARARRFVTGTVSCKSLTLSVSFCAAFGDEHSRQPAELLPASVFFWCFFELERGAGSSKKNADKSKTSSFAEPSTAPPSVAILRAAVGSVSSTLVLQRPAFAFAKDGCEIIPKPSKKPRIQANDVDAKGNGRGK